MQPVCVDFVVDYEPCRLGVPSNGRFKLPHEPSRATRFAVLDIVGVEKSLLPIQIKLALAMILRNEGVSAGGEFIPRAFQALLCHQPSHLPRETIQLTYCSSVRRQDLTFTITLETKFHCWLFSFRPLSRNDCSVVGYLPFVFVSVIPFWPSCSSPSPRLRGLGACCYLFLG